MKQFTFPKAEHLCLKKEIEELFTAGSQSATMFPLRTTFRVKPYSGNRASSEGAHQRVKAEVQACR